MPTVLTLFPHSRHHRHPYANSCLPDSVKKLFVWVEGSAFEIVTGSIESSFRVFFRRSEEEVVPLGRHSLGVKKSCYFKQGIASVLRVRLVSPNTFSRFSFGEVFFFFYPSGGYRSSISRGPENLWRASPGLSTAVPFSSNYEYFAKVIRALQPNLILSLPYLRSSPLRPTESGKSTSAAATRPRARTPRRPGKLLFLVGGVGGGLKVVGGK